MKKAKNKELKKPTDNQKEQTYIHQQNQEPVKFSPPYNTREM